MMGFPATVLAVVTALAALPALPSRAMPSEIRAAQGDARSLSFRVLFDPTLCDIDRIEGDQPDHPTLREKLSTCLRDVHAGDRDVAMSGKARSINFGLDGRRTCGLNHSEAKRRILGIWRSEQRPALRNSRALWCA